MTYASVCSGIEAASVAWEPLGWRPAWFSEIEKFPCAVLAHRFPDVPNLGDMTRLPARVLSGSICAPDVLAGGTPCQSFSVAGMREGIADPRGALTIKFVELADAIDTVRVRARKDPAIIIWENVPGVLSDKGNAFGCFLGALVGEDCELQPSGKKWTNAGCVYGPRRAVAWRVLDAQYFGLAQQRKRVFVVASARTDFDPAAVLFEREGVRRDTPPSREAGKGAAGGAQRGVAHSLRAQAQFSCREDSETIVIDALRNGTVRRLTPIERERLMGLPPDWTRIPWRGKPAEDCPDGPRYKACGNSMAVNVMRWIGRRIQEVESQK